MGSLNIGMVAPTIGGGIETHLRNVIPLLQEKSNHITIVTSDRYELKNSDVVHVKSFPFPSRLYEFMPALMQVIVKKANEWDLVHIHGYPCYAADLFTIFRFLHEIPLVITLHGSFHQYTSNLSFYEKRLHNSLMVNFAKSVDKFVAVSHAEKDIVVKNGLPEDRLVVIYNGINPKYFRTNKNNYLESIFGNGKYILYLGRLTSSKNLDILLTAFRRIIKSTKEARLVLAGPDAGERSRLEKLARELMIDKSIFFLGEVTEDEKLKILSSADVFVHPSVQDIFALTVLEASASALPVVAFDTNGNREMVLNGKTGLLVERIEYNALSESIETILNCRDETRNFGENGRKYVSENFSWFKTAADLENLYHSII